MLLTIDKANKLTGHRVSLKALGTALKDFGTINFPCITIISYNNRT
jgi:hypothetical protein